MTAAVSENASIPHAGDLDQILEQLRSGPVEIVRGDKRAAVVLSPDHFDRLQREADEALVARIKAAEAEEYLGVEASERLMAEWRARDEQEMSM
jgi:hypothetical protein